MSINNSNKSSLRAEVVRHSSKKVVACVIRDLANGDWELVACKWYKSLRPAFQWMKDTLAKEKEMEREREQRRHESSCFDDLPLFKFI